MSNEKPNKDSTSRLISSVLALVCSFVGFLFREAYQEQQRRIQVLEAVTVERGNTIARLAEKADGVRATLTDLELSNRECGRTVTYFSESIRELKDCCKESRERISQIRERR